MRVGGHSAAMGVCAVGWPNIKLAPGTDIKLNSSPYSHDAPFRQHVPTA